MFRETQNYTNENLNVLKKRYNDNEDWWNIQLRKHIKLQFKETGSAGNEANHQPRKLDTNSQIEILVVGFTKLRYRYNASLKHLTLR